MSKARVVQYADMVSKVPCGVWKKNFLAIKQVEEKISKPNKKNKSTNTPNLNFTSLSVQKPDSRILFLRHSNCKAFLIQWLNNEKLFQRHKQFLHNVDSHYKRSDKWDIVQNNT